MSEAKTNVPAEHVHIRNTHIVLKPFQADAPLDRGQHVDARGWISTPYLESQGYIRRLDPHETAIDAACAECCI